MLDFSSVRYMVKGNKWEKQRLEMREKMRER